jgi:hypothetical protein
MGQDGTEWDRMGQDGTGWDRTTSTPEFCNKTRHTDGIAFRDLSITIRTVFLVFGNQISLKKTRVSSGFARFDICWK